MPYIDPSEQAVKIATDFSHVVEAHAKNIPPVEQTKRRKVTYSKPDGIFSSSVAVEQSPLIRGNEGIVFRYFTDKNKGLVREVEMRLESIPGMPSEVISSEGLSFEDSQILIRFLQDPALFDNLSEEVIELRREERKVLDEDRERFERELEEDRERILAY